MKRLAHQQHNSQGIWVKLDPLPFDPRQAFVDRALTLMTDRRYGEGRMSSIVVNSFDRAEIDRAFLDVAGLGLDGPTDFDLDLMPEAHRDPLRSLRALREKTRISRKDSKGRKERKTSLAGELRLRPKATSPSREARQPERITTGTMVALSHCRERAVHLTMSRKCLRP